MQAKGLPPVEVSQAVAQHYVQAKREAMFQRIANEMKGADRSVEQLRAVILKGLDASIVGLPELRQLQSEYDRYQAVKALRRFARPLTDDFPALLSMRDEQATLKVFTEAAGGSGYVDYLPLGDGVVRNVPLWAAHRDFAFPQMGLALACVMLDVDPKRIQITPRSLIIPRTDGKETAVPVHNVTTPRGRAGMFMDIPWFGNPGQRDWELMYDYPEHKCPKQHMPVQFVWEACELQHRMARNIAQIDDRIIFLLSMLSASASQARAATYESITTQMTDALASVRRHFQATPIVSVVTDHYIEVRPDEYDANARSILVARLLAQLKNAGLLEQYAQWKREDVGEDDWARYQKLKPIPERLPELVSQTVALAKDLEKRRAELRAQLHDRAVLMGYIAVGAIADVVPTSLHPRCPGVVVHGVIFNAIMTGDFWHLTPPWVTALIALLLGLLTTAIVARLAAWKALTAAVLLATTYLVFNGVYLFDYHNLLVGMAPPLIAVAAVWSGGTLTRYILETAERRKVEKSFRNYVDPALVDYVLETDDPLDGKLKEMTVVFTDLQGFTTISEQLKEGAVPLLNEYMALMVPIIRKYRGLIYAGLLNKLLGDGMMFFYGAPRDNPMHSIHAVATLLEMQQAMMGFNHSLTERSLPNLIMRGHWLRPDDRRQLRTERRQFLGLHRAGRPRQPHLATRRREQSLRLPHPNERARRELVGDLALFRPIGRIQVKGKHEGVMAFEPLCLVQDASGQHKRLAETTADVVRAFMAGQFSGCLSAIDTMEQAFGPGKLTALYRELCEQYLREPPPAGFDGQIVLTEK